MSATPEAEEVQANLEARLQRWREATDDPLLKGPLKRPEGEKKILEKNYSRYGLSVPD